MMEKNDKSGMEKASASKMVDRNCDIVLFL